MNPIFAMAASGARSKWVQVRQLAAMRADGAGVRVRTIRTTGRLCRACGKGLATWEFFLVGVWRAKAGADKVDSAGRTGYLTRKLDRCGRSGG